MGGEAFTTSCKKWLSYEFSCGFRLQEHEYIGTITHQFRAANIEIMQLQKYFLEDFDRKYFEVRSLSLTNDPPHWKNEIQTADLRRRLTSVLVHINLGPTPSQ